MEIATTCATINSIIFYDFVFLVFFLLILEQIELLKIKWNEDQKKNRIAVSDEDVAKVVCKMIGVPVNKITQDEGEKLLKKEQYAY